jgi:hypothetical protein
MAFEVYSGGHCGVGDTGTAAKMFDRALFGNTSVASGGLKIPDNRIQIPISEWKTIFVDWNMEKKLQ